MSWMVRLIAAAVATCAMGGCVYDSGLTGGGFFPSSVAPPAPARPASGPVETAEPEVPLRSARAVRVATLQPSPEPGPGSGMLRDRNALENLEQAPGHQLFASAFHLTETRSMLASPGPITVLAPTDGAFNRLPKATRAQILSPENAPVLRKVLSYHVVLGRVGTGDIRRMIAEGGGAARLASAFGGELVATLDQGDVVLTDEHGRRARIVAPDVLQSNGLVHVVDGVLLPR